MKVVRAVLLVLSILSASFASVEFISPATGTAIQAGDIATARWRDSGTLPPMSELVQYSLYLCAGGDMSGSYEDLVLLIKDAAFAQGDSVSFRINADVGGNDANAYFLKMIASGPGISVVNYSDRFTLTSMTGLFSPLVLQGIYSVNNDTGDSFDGNHKHEILQKRQVDGSYTIPYHLQTGPTRYAPMAKKPESTIPARSPTPQFPASAYTIATTYLPPATVQVTLSASLTYSVASIENTYKKTLINMATPKASPAPHPHDVQMKQFLERWKD
ncbi:cell wall biosynthesis protein [Aspergillus heteromorphus CBS 117.55]|uniref:Cell wall biosynthesis protein n=1 Tax=Aspergillus heteromorphus CBS 117.55 TaxID=1448321 RepID=A0A317UTP1_9EURO|nr:cell wall biosynthesis protein [Aspergillus heteromorphus CBS 117.55]PWY63897.1 cell wall biosynthesis protein [Aspergillus heteromorphus CBS 117.55]